MDCELAQRLLEADVDGELDLVRHLEIESHVAGCAACARVEATLRARHAALQEHLVRHAAPAGLATRIAAALATAGPPSAASPRRSTARRLPVRQLCVLATAMVLASLFGYVMGSARSRAEALLDEVVAQHVRSMQVDHLIDVASTDAHTVKPWFVGKLDFSPPVIDLAGAGFPLVGGRLDHLDGRSAAALVFQRRQHPINLFVWPGRDVPTLPQVVRDGYATRAWSAAGLTFLAVSEIAPDELGQFVETFRAQVR